jgi:hypothetical protein
LLAHDLSLLQARVFQQMLLHRELFATLYGRRLKFVRGIAPSSVPVNPQRLLELWDYEGSLSAQVWQHVALQPCLADVEALSMYKA